ncbi:MAG TPA: alpha-galactosidase [Armatimonadota bacterium]|nr:alpha-galactosidase [Armatimonadota bacterium]
MARIALIGAGSGFGSRLSVDILSFPALQDSTLCLVDINPEAAEGVGRFVQRVIDDNELPARVEVATDRREVLAGADYVIVSIAVGGPAYDGVPYYHEVAIPAEYGVEQQIADTLGPGGVFRALRCAPEMLAICDDMEELCPEALLINYTNPMAMLCWAMGAATELDIVGLCHSVQGTAHQLAGYIGVPADEVTYWVAGINHMSWFLEFAHQGRDAYPLLFEAMEKPEVFKQDPVRFEIMRHFGAFVTESTPHMSEYVPYFRKRPELIEEFGLHRRRPNKEAEKRERFWQKDDPKESTELHRSGEYASCIIHAIETNTPYRFNGNVPNSGLITNLMEGCCVEVPCLTDGTGVRPCGVGDLPPQLAALNSSNIAVQQLTVEAVLERDLEKAYMAVALDPLTAAVCSLREIRSMFDAMVEAEKPWLEAWYG